MRRVKLLGRTRRHGENRQIDRLYRVLNREVRLDWSAGDENLALDAADPPALIGFDTSALKALRRDPIGLNLILSECANRGITIILPGQVVQEYWNNHRVFSAEDATKVQTQIDQLRKLLADSGAADVSEYAEAVSESIANLRDDMARVRDSEVFLQRSLDVMNELLRYAKVAFVPRLQFTPIAEARLQSKVAPGHEDAKTKAAALGDFFVWADFLLGSLLFGPAANNDTSPYALLVTDDQKSDWRTARLGHPALVAEYLATCRIRLGICNVKEFRARDYLRTPTVEI